MGVATFTNTEIYVGDGSTTSFSFPFYFFNTADLAVYIYDTVAGVITPQVLGTNYTVSGTVNAQGLYPNGGTVTMGSAPTTTQMLVITRAPAEKQTFGLVNSGIIPSGPLVNQFDYLTLLVQWLQDQLSRCVQLPVGFGGTFNPTLPANIALGGSSLQYLQVNQNATGFVLQPNASAWNKIVVPFGTLQTAATTVHTPLFTLPPNCVLTGLILKHTVAFSGVSITDVYAQVGPGTSYSRFISDFDIFASVSDSTFAQNNPGYLGSWTTATTINLTAVASGANLSALAAGSLDVFYKYEFVGAQ